MDRALEHGINFFDTADVYGWKVGEGITEQIIGRWLAQGGGRRDKVVLATKVYGKMSDWPNDQGLSARHIIAACDDSLRRLQTDWIDLYQMHHVDRSTPWEEIWQAMEILVAQGKVLYVGSSNFAGWHIAVAQAEAAKRNFLGLVSEQCIYNLHDALRRTRGRPVRDRATASASSRGRRCTAACCPVRSARSARAPARGPRPGRSADGLNEHRETIEAYEKLCAELGARPGERRARLAAVPTRA